MAFDPISLVTAGASVLGNLVSGIFGSSSQASANEANLEATRETNAQNKELFNQALAWQEDMWNKSNVYNSPVETVKRMEAAGINPALGSQYGNASTPSVPSAPILQPGHVNPVNYDWVGNTISSGVNAYYNNQILSNNVTKSAADSQIAQVNAEFELNQLKYKLIQVVNDTHKSSYEREQARISLSILNRTQEDQVKQASWQTKMQEQNFEQAINSIQESKLRQAAMQIANEYAPRLNEAQLRNYQASISAAYAAARSSDASALESAAHAAVASLQGEGIKIDNRQKRMIASSIISKAQEEAKQAHETTVTMQSRNMYGEARQRLIGSYPVKIEPTPLEKTASRVLNAYEKGVKRGLEKKTRRLK